MRMIPHASRTSWRRTAIASSTMWPAPTWSCSTPAISARRQPRRFIPNLAACAKPKKRRPRSVSAWWSQLRGCVAQAEGAEMIARAPLVDIVVGPAGLSPTAGDGGEAQSRRWPRARHRVSGDRQVRCLARNQDGARSDGISHRAGRLRQVLYVLCRALYARRRIFAQCRPDRSRGAASGRSWRQGADAARPERQRLSRRRAGW